MTDVAFGYFRLTRDQSPLTTFSTSRQTFWRSVGLTTSLVHLVPRACQSRGLEWRMDIFFTD